MTPLQYLEYGTVKAIKGCIVSVSGLDNCISGQLVKFGYGTEGIIIGFSRDESQILLIKEKEEVKTGSKAVMSLQSYLTPVGKNFIGRVVNVLGESLDNSGKELIPDDYYSIFGSAPSVMDRIEVKETVETGIKTVDTMFPIGKGQRQLILGDKMTGKTTIGTDIILNQKGKDVICIYCSIGKGQAMLERVVDLFREKKVFGYTIVVAALAGVSPGQQYLAPYVSCSLGEYFMKQGKHVIVVFDDFTKHAWAYREISLLLERPPGRESYPGDIFYLHSRMIERAAKLSPKLGGGSMTFFPIIETLEGDLTAYVPTNLVSMTDGQLYVNSSLFGEGFKPAIDIGLSVSRIGTKAMWPALKKVAQSLRMDFLQYREQLKVSRLKAAGSSGGDSQAAMKKGKLVYELLKQDKDSPVDMAKEVVLFYGISKNLVLDLDNKQFERLEVEFYDYLIEKQPGVIEEINKTHDLDPEIEKKLTAVYQEYVAKLQKETAYEEGDEEEDSKTNE
jgi:F-type H+/Na+-transporting ATPase subunit alpha